MSLISKLFCIISILLTAISKVLKNFAKTNLLFKLNE